MIFKLHQPLIPVKHHAASSAASVTSTGGSLSPETTLVNSSSSLLRLAWPVLALPRLVKLARTSWAWL
eukprot:CAMPEP_0197695310 /NCGR_PEP_ID=MMETSP1338-20131121/115029_1 /TAXON_ID=43686 ORGANISM="Pelagodinium beii, Strain RCC1491" /NCGR_SAMPLE_ID=MMETSP1338 /ASSEMBLY_ACC=CAM_ASM_000754 /LENGTH=67 /DNA_ID=CAMNT_0043278275 /DNA_START=207 /DNA_END=407 /DNA_ORIENTATION=-